MSLEDEVYRCRERLHKQQSTLTALDLLMDQLRREYDVTALAVDRMARADEIAAAVAKQVNNERRVRFTWIQKACGAIGVAAAVADAVANFLH